MKTLADDRASCLLKKLENSNVVCMLELPCVVSRGSSTGADEVFILKTLPDGRFKTKEGRVVEIEHEILRLPLSMTDFGRYSFHPSYEDAIIFPYQVGSSSYRLLEEDEFRKSHPKAFSYLSNCKKRLENRKEYKAWYGFSAPGDFHIHDDADILVPTLADKGLYARLPEGKGKSDFCLMAGEGFAISVLDKTLSPYYVLSLLNSKTLFWYLKQISRVFHGELITCAEEKIGQLPIRRIDPGNAEEVKLHRGLDLLGQMMMAFNRERRKSGPDGDLATARLNVRRMLWAEASIEKGINALYGLTEEELQIMEE